MLHLLLDYVFNYLICLESILPHVLASKQYGNGAHYCTISGSIYFLWVSDFEVMFLLNNIKGVFSFFPSRNLSLGKKWFNRH